MPFCIIFFVIFLFYLLLLEKNIFNKIFFVVLCITSIFGLIIGNSVINDTIELNVILLSCIMLLLIFTLVKTKSKLLLVSFFTTLVVAGIYYISIQQNIFFSIDYDVYFCLFICLLPAIFFAKDIYFGVMSSTLNVLAIATIDAFLWLKELQYVSLNNINLLNLLSILIVINIGFNRLIFIFQQRRSISYDTKTSV